MATSINQLSPRSTYHQDPALRHTRPFSTGHGDGAGGRVVEHDFGHPTTIHGTMPGPQHSGISPTGTSPHHSEYSRASSSGPLPINLNLEDYPPGFTPDFKNINKACKQCRSRKIKCKWTNSADRVCQSCAARGSECVVPLRAKRGPYKKRQKKKDGENSSVQHYTDDSEEYSREGSEDDNGEEIGNNGHHSGAVYRSPNQNKRSRSPFQQQGRQMPQYQSPFQSVHTSPNMAQVQNSMMPGALPPLNAPQANFYGNPAFGPYGNLSQPPNQFDPQYQIMRQRFASAPGQPNSPSMYGNHPAPMSSMQPPMPSPLSQQHSLPQQYYGRPMTTRRPSQPLDFSAGLPLNSFASPTLGMTSLQNLPTSALRSPQEARSSGNQALPFMGPSGVAASSSPQLGRVNDVPPLPAQENKTPAQTTEPTKRPSISPLRSSLSVGSTAEARESTKQAIVEAMGPFPLLPRQPRSIGADAFQSRASVSAVVKDPSLITNGKMSWEVAQTLVTTYFKILHYSLPLLDEDADSDAKRLSARSPGLLMTVCMLALRMQSKVTAQEGDEAPVLTDEASQRLQIECEEAIQQEIEDMIAQTLRAFASSGAKEQHHGSASLGGFLRQTGVGLHTTPPQSTTPTRPFEGTDTLASVQMLLLLTAWQDKVGETILPPPQIHMLFGFAIRLGYVHGLHTTTDYRSVVVWSFCFIIDQFASIRARVPPQIRDRDVSVALSILRGMQEPTQYDVHLRAYLEYLLIVSRGLKALDSIIGGPTPIGAIPILRHIDDELNGWQRQYAHLSYGLQQQLNYARLVTNSCAPYLPASSDSALFEAKARSACASIIHVASLQLSADNTERRTLVEHSNAIIASAALFLIRWPGEDTAWAVEKVAKAAGMLSGRQIVETLSKGAEEAKISPRSDSRKVATSSSTDQPGPADHGKDSMMPDQSKDHASDAVQLNSNDSSKNPPEGDDSAFRGSHLPSNESLDHVLDQQDPQRQYNELGMLYGNNGSSDPLMLGSSIPGLEDLFLNGSVSWTWQDLGDLLQSSDLGMNTNPSQNMAEIAAV